jgi:hypothetical protein
VITAVLSFSGAAQGEITWKGDFETGDTSQWSYILNDAGISVVSEVKAEGSSAGRITIDASHLWPNGLNRVEFQYAPPTQATAEGADTYFGWSFYLPELLTTDDHQIGYFESDNTYQQVMSVGLQGSTLSFATRRPTNQVHLQADGVIQAGKWHDIILHVHWSQNSADGRVNLWLDGQQLVVNVAAQTLADSNPHFIQLGILRDTIQTEETMYVDNARSGTTLQDVLALVPQDDETGSGGSGNTGAGGSDLGSSGGVPGETGTGGDASAPNPNTGGEPNTSPPEGNDTTSKKKGSGCSWQVPSNSSVSTLSLLSVCWLLLTVFFRRRRFG